MNESIVVQTFKNILIEFNEIKSKAITSLRTEGIDSIFSFVKTNYFIYKNILIVRLNIGVNHKSRPN